MDGARDPLPHGVMTGGHISLMACMSNISIGHREINTSSNLTAISQ